MAVSRRNFLRNTAGAGVVASGMLLPWRQLAMAAEKTQDDFDDYRALVFLLFDGGMDSFNLLIPYDDGEYDQYAKIRTDALRYPQDELLALDDSETDRRFSVPSLAPELRDLFNDGDLAFLANVGPLTQHMNREQYLDESLSRPRNLESHMDQVAQWQTADSLKPLSQQTVGWLGRISDRFGSTLNNGLSMGLSVSGHNLVQTGESDTELLVPNLYDSTAFSSLDEHGPGPKETANEDFELGRIDGRYDNLLRKEYLKRFRRSINHAGTARLDFNDGQLEFNTSFVPEDRDWISDFGSSMQRIVQVISAQEYFGGGAKRQTFFVNFGGWDHHKRLHDEFHWRIEDVSFVLKAFRDALAEIDMLDNVVLFTASDFGRTLVSNGTGSDHGWGGNAMILGGPVNGTRVLGQYPEMDLEGDQVSDPARGSFIPTTSLEEYYAELALWFGLDEEDLELALPNVSSFIPEGATKPDSIGIF